MDEEVQKIIRDIKDSFKEHLKDEVQLGTNPWAKAIIIETSFMKPVPLKDQFNSHFIYEWSGGVLNILKNRFGPKGNMSYDRAMEAAKRGLIPWCVFDPQDVVKHRAKG